MSCTSCLNSSRTALRRVFLAGTVERPPSTQPRYLLAPSLQQQQHTLSNRRFFNNLDTSSRPPFPRPPQTINPRDPVLHPSAQASTHDSRSVKAHKPKGSSKGPASLPRDDAIAEVADYVVLRREDGHLTEPRPLSSVLAEAHIRDQTVVTIVLPRAGQKGGSQHPICVVLDREGYEESERRRIAEEGEREKGESKKKKGTKELEINWAIAPHDLEHKMKRFREFLGKGLRVEMLLLRKSKRKGKVFKQASPDEVEELLRRVREEAASVQGAREFKTASGVVGDKYQLFFEGPQN
ncbi:hypothetical protein CONLIGDRAFT_643699 [Coniochaeta ligniaria NRRL 30616]|uniref:Translation initiation factor 3 N-terminal domain-containing protein n=1 Tax=Coniochaeta ligniaria NRRL 30616 TaxID=1408157 RepID=A0A1J7J8I7_9PEZI|nr:hypothetical protein CONLIGDRAFT_643699 [Coniochaeta ligniaria NRRL 30616]